MDNLFNKKPWVEPLAVAGTSVDVDENDNSEDNSVKSQKQSSNYMLYIKNKSCYYKYIYIYYL